MVHVNDFHRSISLIATTCSPAVRLQPLVCWHPAEWQVTFMPPLPDTAYAAELDCFFGHSDPAAVAHHALAVVGHTLPAAHLPKIALSSNELRLPPCHVGRTAFAALRLSNVVRLDIAVILHVLIFTLTYSYTHAHTHSFSNFNSLPLAPIALNDLG